MTIATWLMTILQRHSPAPRIIRTSTNSHAHSLLPIQWRANTAACRRHSSP